MIAGETSQAYDEIVTMSLVTGRAIGKTNKQKSCLKKIGPTHALFHILSYTFSVKSQQS